MGMATHKNGSVGRLGKICWKWENKERPLIDSVLDGPEYVRNDQRSRNISLVHSEPVYRAQALGVGPK